MFSRRPQLADLLALSVIGQRDAAATRRSLHRRDRDRFLAWQRQPSTGPWNPKVATATQRVERWLGEDERGTLRARLASATAWSFWSAVVLAALLGVAAAGVLFRYDGSRPINVLWVLLVFVLLPLVTALVSGLGMLIGWPRPGWTPGATLWAWIWGKLAKRTWAAAGTTAEAVVRTHAKVLRRALVVHAWWVGQCVGLAFVAAGTLTFVVLLATSDLAFGWASTLPLESDRLADGFAAAFWFAPSLAPDAAILEATVAERATPFADRYAADPERFKAWWRPLLALVLVYGLMPRLLLTAVAGWRGSRGVTKSFALHPAVSEIDARMTTPFVESSDPATAAAATIPSAVPARPVVALDVSSKPEAARWLCWADAPLPEDVSRGDVLAIGGEVSLEDDRRALDAVAEDPAASVVRIAVKAWEPPLAEFTDWLAELRRGLGDGRPVEVVAMVRGRSDRDKAEVWQRALGRLSDPWLRVYVSEVEAER